MNIFWFIFVYRYLMNSIYDYDILSYAKMIVMATLVVRDMDAARFYRNGGKFTMSDRIDVARIFLKGSGTFRRKCTGSERNVYDGRNCESGCTLQTDLNVYNRDKTGIWRTPDACFVLCFICLTDRYRNLRNPCGCPCKNQWQQMDAGSDVRSADTEYHIPHTAPVSLSGSI